MSEIKEKPLWEKTQYELNEYERHIVDDDDELYLKIYNNTVDGMFTITPEMRKFMDSHPYGSQGDIEDPKDIHVIAHYFNPVCNQDWIATEVSYEGEGQTIFYGCVRLFDDIGWEWGDLPSLEELSKINMGPQFGYLRIEKDISVNVGDSLYDVLNAIDSDALYDLGFKHREYKNDEDDLLNIEKQKYELMKSVLDENTYNKAMYYLYATESDIDDIFDVDRFYYDQDNCFDEQVLDDYYKDHDYPDHDALVEAFLSADVGVSADIDLTNDIFKDNSMDFEKEM